MKVSALLAARMGSTRFPGKTLADLHGKPMLERMVQRIRFSSKIDEIILATTDLPEDDSLEEWCLQHDVFCYRGSPTDVLGRLSAAAKEFNAELIVEILGDNPLVHSDLIDAAISLYEVSGVEYVATVTNEYPNADLFIKRFPVGVRVQVFGVETIDRCEQLSKSRENREHATSFIAQHPEIFSTAFVEAAGPFVALNRPELTFAVNYPQQLELIRAIFDYCYKTEINFNLEMVIAAYDQNKELELLMREPC